MRYRMFVSQETERVLLHGEEELIEALSSRGWDLQQRAAREVVESRQRRFQSARESRLSRRPRAAHQ